MFDQSYYIDFAAYCQGDLAEMDKRFVRHRVDADRLAASYLRLDFADRAQRVSDCGTYLEFAHDVLPDGTLGTGKLHTANFCRDRLCPMCAWRRSLKIFGQCSAVMDVIASDYDFLFLTLTVPSVDGAALPGTLDRLMRAWDKLFKRRAVKGVVRGFFRALEITRNNNAASRSYGMYHPHYHAVLAVNRSYWHSVSYLSRDKWLSFWCDAYGDDTITQVDIRRVRPKDIDGNLGSAVAEVAKYAVKSSDFLYPDDTLTDNVVYTLLQSLSGRRLVAFGGIFRLVKSQLGLDDAEDGDLVHIDPLSTTMQYVILRYRWGVGCYNFVDYFLSEY